MGIVPGRAFDVGSCVKCALVVVLIYACLLILGWTQPRLAFQQVAASDGCCYLLDALNEDNSVRYEFGIPSDSGDWSVLVPRLSVTNLIINGALATRDDFESCIPNYVLISLGETGKGADSVELVFTEKVSGRVFLIRDEVIAPLFDAVCIFRTLSLGALLGFSLIEGFLFWSKRSERYLFWASSYTALLAFWVVITSGEFQVTTISISGFIVVFLNNCALLLSVFVGFKLLGLRLAESFRNVFAMLFWAMAVCMLSAFLSTVVPGGSVIIRGFFAAIGVTAALYALLHVQKKTSMLTVVFVLSRFLYANSSLLIFLGLSDSLFYTVLFTVPVFDLPYVMAILVVTCKRFANKFTDAEVLSSQLDELVTERTAQLELRERQQHQLMMNVFHDLRSPLFALKGTMASLRAHPSQIGELLPVMEERVMFMQGLTSDLFLLAKMEVGKVLFAFDTVDVSGVVKKAVLAAMPLAEERSIDLCLDCKGKALVDGDEMRLTQVFDNLLANAVSYADMGTKVKICVDTCDNSVVVSVTNRGGGLSREELDHVFDQYYHRSSSSKVDSTGLGLSIAKSIIDYHDGSIVAESVKDAGTCFIVTLPLVPDASESAPSFTSA